MKEKQTYRRFDLPSFLAILGCAGMLVFECVFIFELYDRTPSQVASLLPVEPAPVAVQTGEPAVSRPDLSVPEKSAPAPVATNAAPVSTEPARPVPPDESGKTPATAIPAG